MNIYLATGTRIRKFSPDGAILWTWQTGKHDGKMVASPALYNGAIFAASGAENRTTMYSIDMAQGTINWKRVVALHQNSDASSVFVYNNTMLVPVMNGASKGQSASPGNNVVYAVNSSDGSYLWNFIADDVFWNFAPATPGDGTLLIASNCGGVFRITFGGQLVWRKGERNPGHICSLGGGALGPNGVYYVEYDDVSQNDVGARVAAFQVSDGAQLWKRTFKASERGMQYPAIGRLGSGGALAVVVAIGQPSSPPPKPEVDEYGEPLTPEAKEEMKEYEMKEAYQKGLPEPTQAPQPQLRNSVVAMDALSGEILWRFDEDPWDKASGAGEREKFTKRQARAKKDPRADVLCEAHITQGIPLIAGDGTVYTSSGHSGDLHAIRDVDGNGIIDKAETSVFSTHNCFLNSPSLAPGMLVAAPCWGPMYVFKDAKR
jgi:outer membrane protein assembly factor BamB